MICTALLSVSTLVACGGGGTAQEVQQTALGTSSATPPTAIVVVPAIDTAAVVLAAPAPSVDDSPAPRVSELVAAVAVGPSVGQVVAPTETATSFRSAAGTPPTPLVQNAPQAGARPIAIATADIAAHAPTSQAISNQAWGNVQCNGHIIPSQLMPAAGLHGSRLPNGETLRFGLVPDASSASGASFELTLNAEDPLTARSDRCELAFPASAEAGIPKRAAFWHAFSVKLGDWSATSDEQAIAQWHAGDTSGGLLPIYTLLVRGTSMRLVLRYDTSSSPARATARAVEVWSTPAAPNNAWITVVTQALMSTDLNDGPFIKTWMNGTQIVDYAGPIGYDQPTVQAYAKHGIYHWVDQYNPWDAAVPTRTLRLKDPMLIRDTQRRYEAATVRAFVEGN